jgi:hypothetical protein
MIPTSPVVPGSEEFEVTYAADQPEYIPLPVVRTEVALLSRWKLTEDERRHIANGGDLFIAMIHFGQNLQPICPIADTPEKALEILMNLV